MMSQCHQEHMMMPAEPTAHFVMVETDFAFGFLKNDPNGPTHAADAHELDQGCIGWGIAEVELDFRWVIQVATDDQPDFGARQVTPRFGDAQEGKVTHDGAFAAFFDGGSAPTFFRDRSDQLPDLDRAILWVAQTQASGVATPAFPPRHIHFG